MTQQLWQRVQWAAAGRRGDVILLVLLWTLVLLVGR